MRENNLKKIPDNIGQLKSLQKLDLYNNKINSVPIGITNLKNLKLINLVVNPVKISKKVQIFFNEMKKHGLIVNN